MGEKFCYFTRLKYFFCVTELEPSISALSATVCTTNGICILPLNCKFLTLYHPKGGLVFVYTDPAHLVFPYTQVRTKAAQ